MSNYDQGTYASGTYAPNPYSQQREDARQKLARFMAQRDATMQGDVQRAQSESNLTWGDDAAKGAMLGAIGGPHTALIGGAIGGGIGLLKAASERHKHGQNWLEAGLNTVGDVFSPRGAGAVLDAPSTVPLASMLAGKYAQQQALDAANPKNYTNFSTGNGMEQDFQFTPPDSTVQDLAAQGDPSTGYGGHFQQHLTPLPPEYRKAPDEYNFG